MNDFKGLIKKHNNSQLFVGDEIWLWKWKWDCNGYIKGVVKYISYPLTEKSVYLYNEELSIGVEFYLKTIDKIEKTHYKQGVFYYKNTKLWWVEKIKPEVEL